MQNKFTLFSVFLTITLLFASTAESNTSEIIPAEKELAKISETTTPVISWEEEISELYKDFNANNISMPSLVSFTNGMKGYQKLEDEGKVKNKVLTIVDFSLPSSEKRMWILDMTNQEVLLNTYVAHGRNTGLKMATDFSNTESSFQSSLGFYVTAETYYGKNGLSLFLDGQEKGFNSNARQRYVVVHGADYANPDFIERTGRLGRSLGCPAVPTALTNEVINTIKGSSVLFIYHPSEEYARKSTFLNPAVV